MRTTNYIVLSLLVAGTLVLIAFSQTRAEPRQNGKRLGGWLAIIANTRGDSTPAEDAVRLIGADAIPVLLQMIDRKDSPLRARFIGCFKAFPWGDFPIPAAEIRWRASEGFCILGTKAGSAAPQLVQLLERSTNEPGTMQCLSRALAGIGEAAILPLSHALTNQNPTIRYYVLGALANLVAETDSPSSVEYTEKGPAPSETARLAMSLLLSVVKNGDGVMQARAITIIEGIGGRPESIASSICERLQDTNIPPRELRSMINTLGRFGAASKTAVPQIEVRLEHPNRSVRLAAKNALRQIGPKTVANVTRE